MKSVEIVMAQEKVTAHYVVFKEVSTRPHPTIEYVSKEDLKALGDPEKITVEITPFR